MPELKKEVDIKKEVRRFILDTMLMAGTEDDLKDDVSLQRHGVIDSTGVLELVGFLESRFGIEIADDELHPRNLDTLDAIDRFVRSKLGARPA